jgi:hypothetical protein
MFSSKVSLACPGLHLLQGQGRIEQHMQQITASEPCRREAIRRNREPMRACKAGQWPSIHGCKGSCACMQYWAACNAAQLAGAPLAGSDGSQHTSMPQLSPVTSDGYTHHQRAARRVLPDPNLGNQVGQTNHQPAACCLEAAGACAHLPQQAISCLVSSVR